MTRNQSIQWSCHRCNYNMQIGATTPVGVYPAGASPYDGLDMSGNVSIQAFATTASVFAFCPADGRRETSPGLFLRRRVVSLEVPGTRSARILRGAAGEGYGCGSQRVRLEVAAPVPGTSNETTCRPGDCAGDVACDLRPPPCVESLLFEEFPRAAVCR